jgi:hypothetical protein
MVLPTMMLSSKSHALVGKVATTSLGLLASLLASARGRHIRLWSQIWEGIERHSRQCLPSSNQLFFTVVILTAALEGALNRGVGCCGQTGQVMQKIGDCFC